MNCSTPTTVRRRSKHDLVSPRSPAAGLIDHLKVVYRCPAELKPGLRNARTHSPAQIHQIARSIEKFGFTNPILLNGDDVVLAGHGRLEAAKRLALAKVPTLRLDHLTAAEQRAYAIADNRLAELAGWDRQLLALELQDLLVLEPEIELDITGFSTAEIDVLCGELSTEADATADVVPALEDGPSVTRLGDLWHIGPHRLLCGDATSHACYTALLQGERAQLCLTDPPYNVPIDGHVSGLGRVKHREFAMASGEMSPGEFTTFLKTVFSHLADNSCGGAIQFIFMDWRHLGEVLGAAEGVYSELKNFCVWTKSNAGMGSLYRSQHELIFVYKAGTDPHINNVELGRFGRYRTNVWSYAGANTFAKGREEELSWHPTVKPVALVADAILDCSHRRGIVLDPFLGSGTTLVAAHKTGRRGFGLELDGRYCDVILRRLRCVSGTVPVLQSSGESFDNVAAARLDGKEH